MEWQLKWHKSLVQFSKSVSFSGWQKEKHYIKQTNYGKYIFLKIYCVKFALAKFYLMKKSINDKKRNKKIFFAIYFFHVDKKFLVIKIYIIFIFHLACIFYKTSIVNLNIVLFLIKNYLFICLIYF